MLPKRRMAVVSLTKSQRLVTRDAKAIPRLADAL